MILSLSLAAAAVQAQPGEARPLRRVVALLDYVSNDYARAVGEHGEVLSEAEHAEQIGFVQDAASELRADVDGRGEDLAKRLDALVRRVEGRAPPAEVARTARAVRDEIVQRFGVVLVPQRAPDLRHGAEVYAQSCAACHGADGRPDPALGLETKPPDFTTESGPFTAQRIFSAATYGVPKTAMPAFDSGLTDEDRWDVAFYLLTLAHPGASPRGLELARAALTPTRYRDLAILSDDDLRARLAAAGLRTSEQEQALAATRAGPFAEDAQSHPQGLAQARGAVQKAVSLARKGDRGGAGDRAARGRGGRPPGGGHARAPAQGGAVAGRPCRPRRLGLRIGRGRLDLVGLGHAARPALGRAPRARRGRPAARDRRPPALRQPLAARVALGEAPRLF